jgi:isocitrate dehydrogenase kinase/phosphatase
VSTEHLEAEVPIFRCYYLVRDGFCRMLAGILDDFGFRLPFRNRRRDLCDLLRTIRARYPTAGGGHQNFQLVVLTTPFYRNKAAYVIGKAVNGADEIFFVMPVLNDERGGLYIEQRMTPLNLYLQDVDAAALIGAKKGRPDLIPR